MPALLRLLRPKQWTKNLLVFAALLFTAGWRDPEAFGAAVWAFIAVCLVSSATYVLNDLVDQESDRRHPVKRNRPIASGAVSSQAAMLIGAACAVGGLMLGSSFAHLALPLAVFLGTQLLYTFVLKKLAILDVMTLSALFVQRAVMGALAIQAPISPWILMCTATLALMLGFGKRRQEFRGTGAETRDSLRDYSSGSLDAFVWLSAGLSLISYLLYVVESDTARAHSGLLFTAPFVIFGVLRYLLVLSNSDAGEEPESVLLQDRFVLGSVVGFAIVVVLAMGNQLTASGVVR